MMSIYRPRLSADRGFSKMPCGIWQNFLRITVDSYDEMHFFEKEVNKFTMLMCKLMCKYTAQ